MRQFHAMIPEGDILLITAPYAHEAKEQAILIHDGFDLSNGFWDEDVAFARSRHPLIWDNILIKEIH